MHDPHTIPSSSIICSHLEMVLEHAVLSAAWWDEIENLTGDTLLDLGNGISVINLSMHVMWIVLQHSFLWYWAKIESHLKSTNEVGFAHLGRLQSARWGLIGGPQITWMLAWECQSSQTNSFIDMPTTHSQPNMIYVLKFPLLSDSLSPTIFQSNPQSFPQAILVTIPSGPALNVLWSNFITFPSKVAPPFQPMIYHSNPLCTNLHQTLHRDQPY